MSWGPWIIGSGVAIALSYVNTKFEALRDQLKTELNKAEREISERRECTRHLEAQQKEQRETFETWRLQSTTAHERSAAADAKQDVRHEQNSELLRNLTAKVERAIEQIPDIIIKAQADMTRRMAELERQITRLEMVVTKGGS